MVTGTQLKGSNSKNDLYGIYRAKCLDNNDPTSTGKILVHIYERDGKLSFEKNTHQWIPVLSPYGGISGMGLLMLPPINSDGYVIFEGGMPSKPVWVGSYPFASEKTLNQEASQSNGYPVLEINPSVPIEMNNDPTTIILKTQYPTVENQDPKSKDNHVENLIIMNQGKLELIHRNQLDYKFEPFGITTDSPTSYITLSDGSVKLGVKTSNGKRNEISIDDGGIKLRTTLGEEISLKDGKIDIKGTDKSQINITARENGSVNINGKTVVLDGETVVVGPPGDKGGSGVVNADCICPFTNKKTHTGSTKTILGG